jgi:hypothetical protein
MSILPSPSARLIRERRTVAVLIDLYCRVQHGTQGELCATCGSLAAYAAERLARCRFGAKKPTCARCPAHCYSPSQREKIKQIMRYSGPRLLWRHPIWAMLHVWDGWRSNVAHARILRKPG